VKGCQSYPEFPMRFDIITLFPDFFTSPLGCGLMSKALAKEIASVHITNPRNFTIDRHHKVNDDPYGGGVGMGIKPEPIFAWSHYLFCHGDRYY